MFVPWKRDWSKAPYIIPYSDLAVRELHLNEMEVYHQTMCRIFEFHGSVSQFLKQRKFSQHLKRLVTFSSFGFRPLANMTKNNSKTISL